LSHVSYSEIKIWHECPYKHKLQYIDCISGFVGNEHTVFGTAIHSVCEHGLLNENLDKEEHFKSEFEKGINDLKEKKVTLNYKLIEEMMGQYKPIISSFSNELENYFGPYEIINTEEELYEDIEGFDKKFKGFIDLVIKTKTDDKYHILDWKTCSWGWNAKKKADTIINYQLILYKYFWSKKHNIPLNKIETHFGLLKRTAKKDNVEIFRITSGEKKIKNALTFLNKAVTNIIRNVVIKNRLSCTYCPFYKTQHCK